MLQEELWISKWKLICKQQGEATIDQKARKEGGMEDREKDSPVGQKQGDETTSRILWLNWSLGMRTVFSKPNPCLLNCKSLEGNYWTRVFRTALTANPRERVSIYRIIGWKKKWEKPTRQVWAPNRGRKRFAGQSNQPGWVCEKC